MKRWFKSLGLRRCWVVSCILVVLVLLSAPNTVFVSAGDEDCPDLDGLSQVDFGDLSILGDSWRLIGRNLPADLNTDSIVNIKDLAILAGYWLDDCALLNLPDIETVNMDPASISVRESTQVTITAQIEGEIGRRDLEVELLRLDAHGQIVDIVGYLHDDGLRGDARAGDNIFTIQRTFSEPQPTQVILQVAVVDDIYHTRKFSDILIIVVEPLQPQIDPGKSLHLMTFNTQLMDIQILSTFTDPTFINAMLHAFGVIPDIEDEYGMDNEDRAQAATQEVVCKFFHIA